MMHAPSKYLEFMYCSDTGKTKIIQVLNRNHGDWLGEIRWYGPWRQYCFMPASDAVFNKGCLNDINSEIDILMEERKTS